MPDPTPVVTPPPVAPATTQNQPPAPPANEPAKPLTVEQLKEVLAPFEQRLNGLSGIVSGLQRGTKRDDPPAATPPKEPSLADQASALSSLQKELNTERIENAITAAAAKQVGERSDQFTKYITAIYGSQLVVENRQVVHVGTDGQKTPVATWVNAFLQTRDGEVFLPPKAAPGGSGTTAAGRPSGDHPYKALPFKEIMEKRSSDPGAFAIYCAQHPEDFGEKQRSFNGR